MFDICITEPLGREVGDIVVIILDATHRPTQVMYSPCTRVNALVRILRLLEKHRRT